uniref:Colicin-M n=2 Tax=Serratia TaxID=613 RepID=A0A1C3HMA4_SERMA|nr:Colicin-M [Serratia marcescens]
MSDTLTVIATAPTGFPYSYTFSDMGNFNEAGSAFDNPVAVEALQLAHAILSMEDGSYTKGLLARWLELGKEKFDMNILKRFAQTESYRADHPETAYFDIKAVENEPGKKVTANAFAPFLGMWNYLKADGAPLSLDVTSIGLTFNRDILTPVSFALNNNPPGQYPISGNFGKSVFDDNFFVASLLGRISMTTEGTLTINESGSWSYTGEVRSFNDTFDANFDPSRGEIAQAATTILSWFPGQPFPIELPGTIPVELSGQR